MMQKDTSSYSEELTRFIRFLEGAKKRYDDCKLELGRQELLKTDLLHLLELKCTSAQERTIVSEKLQRCLLWRRECKDTIALLEPLILFMDTDKGKFVINQLPQVLGNVRKEEKRISLRSYSPRIMTYEEFETSLTPEEPNPITDTATEDGEASEADSSSMTYDSENFVGCL